MLSPLPSRRSGGCAAPAVGAEAASSGTPRWPITGRARGSGAERAR